MSFIADQQTLEDLNITGKYKPDSVFNLFNRCRSSGGEKLLESMFRNPLQSADLINERILLLQYFREKNLSFPFTGLLLNQVNEYLYSNASGNILMTTLNLFRKRAMAMLFKDEAYQVMLAGIQAAITMLRGLRQLTARLETDSPFGEQARQLRQLFDHPGIREMMTSDEKNIIPLRLMARYHHLLTSNCYENIEQAMAIICQIDVYIAVTDVARARGFSQPKALPPGKQNLQVTGLYHPLLMTAKAVANNLSFQPDRNILFLTGANMAGKSTLMKAFGIALYLAHMGFPVAAESMSFPVMDGIYSSINVPDNLALGYSHFYAEVMRVKKVAEDVSSGKKLVVIFDELFKGTNVQDAFDATLAVTESFAAYHRCFFIISTHVIEVGQALQKDHNNLQYAFLPTVMNGDTPQYTYRLTEGITTDRQGMIIIANESILEILGESQV